MIRENAVRKRLASGEVSLGTMVFEFASPGLAQLAGLAGAEFVIFDQEHNGWSSDTLRWLLATARSSAVVPLVRPPATQYHLLAGLLDLGALGLMVPMVESEEQARLIVASAKYPPEGRRGAGFGLAHDGYTGGSVPDKMRAANRNTLLMAQVETAAGVEAADRIAAVPGIDVLWIGHYDLTNSLGIPGQFDHPAYLAAVERVLAATRAHGKALGMMVGSVAEGRACLDQGFRILAYGRDTALYQDALASGLAALRSA